MKRISVLGATGSIGQNTLDLLRRDAKTFQVVALTGARNIAQLAKDAVAFKAEYVATAHEDLWDDLKNALSGTGIACGAGQTALLEAAAYPADCTISGILGAAGLLPGLKSLEHGNTIALANKESLVCAGPLFMQTAQKYGATVLPIDSEHCAIFQALGAESIEKVDKITITASGGALHDMPLQKLPQATPLQALAHPIWSMGERLTIDSASMFNKAMEVIEAKEFFGFGVEQIDVLIHRQSIIHAMVAFCDGGVMAHMGTPDMRHAIGFALNYPMRKPLPIASLDLAKIGQLSFEAPCEKRHRPLTLAKHVIEQGGNAGAVFNAAKEIALDRFMGGDIGFLQMTDVVERSLNTLTQRGDITAKQPDLEAVLQTDSLARDVAARLTF